MPRSVFVPMKTKAYLVYQGLIVVIEACFALLTTLTKDTYFKLKSEKLPPVTVHKSFQHLTVSMNFSEEMQSYSKSALKEFQG